MLQKFREGIFNALGTIIGKQIQIIEFEMDLNIGVRGRDKGKSIYMYACSR